MPDTILRPRLLLIDATGYLFRAFHAVGDLHTRDGKPSGAIYGVLAMIDKLRRLYPGDKMVCVMDARGKTFRHHLSPDYKAHRPPLDENLAAQIDPVKRFIESLGLPLLCVGGVEADDVIATLAKQGEGADMKVVIATADKDLMALVNERVVVYDGMKEMVYDADGVMKKFAVFPSQMVDYLSLIGDSADNIAGVKKVGAKTAAKWLAQYHTLDNIVARADEIGGKVGENLRAAIAADTLQLAKTLITLNDKVPAVALCDLQSQTADVHRFRRLCEEYDFRQLSQRLLENFSQTVADRRPPTTNKRAKLVLVNDIKTLAKWAEKIEQAGVFAVDTETDGTPVMAATLVGFSLAVDDKTAAYIPLAHRLGEKTLDTPPPIKIPQIPMEEALSLIRPLLENPAIVKIAHNAKYDCHVFANVGITVCGVVEDTKIAAYIAHPDRPTTASSLSARHLQFETINYRDVVDGKKIRRFSEVNIETACRYAAEDAEVAWKLKRALIDDLPDGGGVYEKIDRPLMPILLQMERAGVRIDTGELKKLSETLRARMKVLEAEAMDIAVQISGERFNINSPRQLETLLFDKLGATADHKTAGGKYRSTDERALEKLSADFPLAKTVLQHRVLSKLVNTYAEKLPQMVNPKTGRVHTDFNQTAVITGRLASSAPNLQNIPIRNEEGRRIRRAFIAADNAVLVSADYSQIELRLMAHISGDEELQNAFFRGADIHRQTAAEVFSVDEESVSNEQRRAAKAINFGLIYGMSPFGLARALAISTEQAKEYIRRYFAHYTGVADFMEQTRQTATDKGYAQTIFGRRIPLSGHGNKQAAVRAAINAPMQGGAADLIKLAMLAVSRWLKKEKMQSRLILQVHDELVLEVPKTELSATLKKLPPLMCNVAKLSVPLQVSINAGDNWDAAH